jgi:hypothetical protein
MIVTPRLVFIHLHKSGGTFVNDCLRKFVPGAQMLGYHLPRSAIPATLSDRPMLGFVRNPWSYYVSWYSFQVSRPRQNLLYRALSDEGRQGFEGTIRNMLSLSADEDRLQALVAALPDQYSNQGLNLPGFALAPILGTGRGFYSYLADYMFGGPGPGCIGRMETLRDDLPRMLDQVGEPMSDAFRTHVRQAAPSNTSKHGPYQGYYSAPLQRLVAQHDAPIIERFDYHFAD